MAWYNKHINIARTSYDFKNKIEETKTAIENKEIEAMTFDEFEKYLSFLTQESHYVEKSQVLIRNASNSSWKKEVQKGSYENVNKKINKLNQLGFYDIIANKNNNAREMMKNVLTFNNLNKEIFLSEQRGGVVNESIRSFKESYEYLMRLKKEALEENEDRSFFVFDLETTGGKNLAGVWEPDSITEFSLQEFDFEGTRINNHTMIVGLDRNKGEKVIEEIEAAIKDGSIHTNEKLRVSAMRYASYGNKDTTYDIDKKTGLMKVTNFAKSNAEDLTDIDKIAKGVNVFIDANDYYNKSQNMINGIPLDKYRIGEALKTTYERINNGKSSLIGQNHLGHDMPIIQNQMMLWEKQYGDFFKLNLDFKNPAATLDTFGGFRGFIEYNGVSKLYPGSTMSGVEKVAGQEYLVEAHLKSIFEKLNAHQAEHDVTALGHLVITPSELLNNGDTVLDHIYKGLANVKTTDTKLEVNKHVLRAKRRAGSYGGKGYINFASDSEGTIYTASDHIFGKKDAVSEHIGGALHENFNVGFGVNKGAFYELEKIEQIQLTDEMRYALGDLAPEYSGQYIYHLQLSMAVTDKYRDSRLGDLKQHFFFKNKKELEGFTSAYFDVVAKHGENGIELIKEHIDKLDIRELKDVQGKAVFEDVLDNWQKNAQELYDNALDFQANKVLTSRAENTFLRNSSYNKITKALSLEEKILEIYKEAGIDKKNLTQRDINKIMSGNIAKGEMAIPLNNSQIMKAQDIINQTLSYEKKVNGNKIDRLLDSTVDNYSSIMSFISNNKVVLNNILKEVEERLEGYSDKYKQEMFSRIYDSVKRDVAEYIYRNSENTNPAEAIAIFTDERLKTNLHDFKNMYEIDFSSLVKDNKMSYISIEKPQELAHVQRFDIGSKTPMYSMINKATEAVFGKDYRGTITDEHKQVAVEKLFTTLMKEDKNLRETKVIKEFKNQFMKEGKFIEPVNFLNIADTLVAGMQEVKANDKFAGIKNLRYSFMKSLEGNSGFIAALNSKKAQERVKAISKDIIENTSINLISSEYGSEMLDKELSTIVDKVLLRHYVPDENVIKKLFENDKKATMLYNKGVEDIRTYLMDTIKGFAYIDGTDINIQKDGSLLITNGGNAPLLLSKLPKIKLDEDSNILYTEIGGKKTQFFRTLQVGKGAQGITGDVGTTLSQINEYSNSRSIKYIAEKKGPAEALNSMMSKIAYDMKQLGEGPTINGFGGNDLDSNHYVDLSDVRKLLTEIFSEDGSLKDFADTPFIDRKLKETLKDQLKYAKKDKDGFLKELSPGIARDIVKDIPHLLEEIAFNARGQFSQEFIDILQNKLSFSSKSQNASKAIAYEGIDRPHNSTFGVFDNTQRPTVTQSGNAKFLRMDKHTQNFLKDRDVWMGNILETSYSAKKIYRDFYGIGDTTTDVMLNTYYAGTQALKVIMNNNFNEVIAKAKVDLNSEDMAKNVYSYIAENINTFEQERVMDSRIFEQVYGLQAAQTQKLSKGIDIKSISKDLTKEELQEQKRFIAKHLGDIIFDENGEVYYESAIGTHIKRGQGTIKSKGFADLTSAFTAKVKDGVFNHYYYNSAGMKLSDKDINKIIQDNLSVFKDNNGFVGKHEFRQRLDELLASKSIYGQYVIEDMNALGYAKTMTSGSEKGMTDILYATTGKYNEEVRKVFQNIGEWETVQSKVLTEEAIDALILKDKNNTSYLEKALAGTSFNTLDDLKLAMRKERHINSKMLFEYALGGKAHLLTNDNVLGHGNFGQMYQGSLSKAIELVSKKHENGLEGAVQTIVDMINGTGEFANTDFKFMENWKMTGDKIGISHIGVHKNKDGRLVINDNFFTDTDNLSNLNANKFNALLRELDARYLKDNNNTDSDNRLVRENVYMFQTNDKGEQVLKEVKEMVGAYYSTKIDGKTVILGAQTKENTKIMTDVETQSGVTDEYFAIKKALTNLKKEKIELETALNTAKDDTNKSILNKKLIEVKNEISKVQQDLSQYDDAVKTTRVGDQELSIINRIAITQSQVDSINDLISDNKMDEKVLDDMILRGKIYQGEDGIYRGTSDLGLGNILKQNKDGEREVGTGDGIRVLDWYTQKIKDQQWYDPIKDVKLDEKYLELDEYKHLKDVYNHFNNKNIDIGVDKAQQVYQARMAKAARDFNESGKNELNRESLLNKGFKTTHIEDLTLDVEALSTQNLLIDLGESVGESYRYVAVPGTGKVVVDEDLRRKSHSTLAALKHKYEEYVSIKGSNPEEEQRLITTMKSLSDDIIKNVDAEMFNKNAMLHNMSKVELTDPAYRTKLSGVIGSHFDDALSIAYTADGKKIELASSLSYSATNKAMIGEKTIAQWEKEGIHHDYKFISMEQFEKMGYFNDDKLKQFGFLTADNTRDDAIKQMKEHLKTNGTIDMFDRYPNTRTGSIVPTFTFLDETLTQNQSKISVTTAMKANADYDGDSGSNYLIRFFDEEGRQIDGSYMHRVRNVALENLNAEGKDISKVTAQEIAQAAEATGMISRKSFEKFQQLETQMVVEGITHNRKWAKKGQGIITKDSLKNVKIGDISKAVMVDDGYSELFGSNIFSRLSVLPNLNDFNQVEENAIKIIQQAQDLDKQHNISQELFKVGDQNEKKAWKKFHDITDIRNANTAEAMDKAVAIMEVAQQKGKIGSDVLDFAKSTAVKRVTHDRYIQEVMAHTGLPAVGNVNLSLNAIKLATQFTESSPKDIMFTNFIWSALDVAEQGIISDKKRDKPGYDDPRIKQFSEAMKKIYSDGKNRNLTAGINELESWMKENGGDIFEIAYDEMGKYIFGTKQYLSMSKEDGIKAMEDKFFTHVRKTSEDTQFKAIKSMAELVGRNSGHDKNIPAAIMASAAEDTLSARTLDATGYSDAKRTALYKSLIDREQRMAMKSEANREVYIEGLQNMKQSMKEVASSATSNADDLLKHVSKIPLGGGSGLGKAMTGLAIGLLASGYASGNPLNDKSAQQVAEGQMQPPKQTMSVPQFMDQGGMVTGNSQGGYVINLQADTKKGRKYMKRMMAQAAQASVGGAVSVNMNLRDVSQNGVTDRDIENYMNRYL